MVWVVLASVVLGAVEGDPVGVDGGGALGHPEAGGNAVMEQRPSGTKGEIILVDFIHLLFSSI